MSATDELRRLLDERGIHWWAGADERKTLWESNGLTWEYFNDENGDAWLGFLGACEQDITPEQAIAATLGRPTFDASLEQALSFMRIWISDDAHLGESAISRELEKAEGLRKLDAIESAIAATLGVGECEVECFDDGVDEDMDGEWFSYAPPKWYLSCGHEVQGTERPNYCVVCGKAVKR